MARGEFGGTGADTVFGRSVGGTAKFSAAKVTGWTAKIGGSQYNDFLLNGASVSEIPIDDDGQIPVVLFPDNVMSLWLSANGGPRVLARAAPPPIFVVPVGTTGFATQPDNTLWFEYVP
jgi:hypothetical protein